MKNCLMKRKPRKVAVIDLETAALKNAERNVTEERALIYTAAVITFDLFGDIPLFDEQGRLTCSDSFFSRCYVQISTVEQLMLGRVINDDTTSWWEEQTQDAIDARNGNYVSNIVPIASPVSVRGACQRIADVLSDCEQVFARGKEFDGNILANLFHMADMSEPWKYHDLHDVRTFVNAITGSKRGYVASERQPEWLIKHCSFHDALWDAEQLRKIAHRQNKKWWEFMC